MLIQPCFSVVCENERVAGQTKLQSKCYFLLLRSSTKRSKQRGSLSRIQTSNTLVGYCWRVVKPFIAVLVLYKRVKARRNGGTL